MDKLSANKEAFIRLMTKSEDHAQRGFSLLLKRDDFADFFDDLKAAGLFDKSKTKGPVPVPGKEHSFTIPYWEALSYLSAVAKKAGDTNSDPLANKVLDVVRDISNERIDGKPKDNYHTSRTFIEILSLVPTDAVSLSDIDMLEGWLQGEFAQGTLGQVIGSSLLPKWLSGTKSGDWEKACKALKYSLTVRWVSNRGINSNDPVAVIEDFWLSELLKHNLESFAKKCPEKSSDIFLEKLREVYSIVEGKIPSWSARPAIEDHPQNYSWKGVENEFVEGVRDIANIWLQTNDVGSKLFVKKLLEGELEIEHRIGIYLVNVNFEKLQELTDQIIPLLPDTGHLHELYNFLLSRFAEFTPAQKTLVVAAIRNIPKPSVDDGDIILQRAQRKWLNVIKNKGSTEADKFFNELNQNKEPGGEFPHPDFLSWMESRSGPGPSEYTPAQLISFLDDKTLVEKLNAFQANDDDFWTNAPTTRALVDSLEEAVTKDPLKFRLAINEFGQAGRPYQYGLINGFKKLWDSGKEIGDDWAKIWEQLLKLFNSLLSDENFWNEPVVETRDLTPNRYWIVSLIADFLRAGVKKDDRSIPITSLPIIEPLVFTLVDKIPSEWRSDNDDAMTQSINTMKGRSIEALLEYALFTARLSDKNEKEHKTAWDKVEPIFNRQLSSCKGGNQEFSTLLGAYATNLEYLDYEWLKNNIRTIFSIEYPENFDCAIAGLAYAPASKRLYLILRDADIIQAALERTLKGRQTRENLIQRIALAYLWGDEVLDSKVLKNILRVKDLTDLHDAVRFFWSIRDREMQKKQMERVLDFWEMLSTWLQTEKLDDKFSPLLSVMGLLSSYLDEITDEQKQWLILSAPFIGQQYHADLFIDELDRLADTSPIAVKDIFLKLLETYSPSFDLDGKLRSLISKLIDQGHKEDMLSVIEKLHYLQGFQDFYTEVMTQN